MISKYFLVLGLVISSLQLFASDSKERKLYVGKNSSEAKLTFKFFVEIPSQSVPDKQKIDNALEEQMNHLFGPMGEARILAVPKGDHVLTHVSAPVLKEGTHNIYRVTYSYKGTVAVENKAKNTYEVILPYNPTTIYDEAKVGNRKPCTDSHYDSEGDFWYFWSPDKYGCKLQEGVHYARIQGNLERIQNTVSTYPEYDKLIREANGRKVIFMSMLMGMDEESNAVNPLKSKDINASNYRAMRNSLIKMGFKNGKPWTHRQIENYFNKNLTSKAFVEEFAKETPKATLVVRMFFGSSNMYDNADAFHYFYKDAMENQSVLMYDGHSGLGGHLDLDSMESLHEFKIKASNKYQIYYFNSCSSYSYYNTMYFERKKSSSDPRGTKTLDILTNGLATAFAVMHDTNLAIVKAIDLWATGKGSVSYQTLAKQIDSENLFGVNGDEDNSTQPIP